MAAPHLLPPRPLLQHDPGNDLQGELGVTIEQDHELRQPKQYRVLLHNDNYTTMEFVVEILVDIFHHPVDEAVRIMLDVHYNGIGSAGVFTYEVAETKIGQVTALARQQEYPLLCTMEPV